MAETVKRRMGLYRFRDGVTPLSGSELNFRFFDVDGRLFDLERLKVSWEQAVAEVQNEAAQRLNDVLAPAIAEVQNLLDIVDQQWDEDKTHIAEEWDIIKEDIEERIQEIEQDWVETKAGYDGHMTLLQGEFDAIVNQWENEILPGFEEHSGTLQELEEKFPKHENHLMPHFRFAHAIELVRDGEGELIEAQYRVQGVLRKKETLNRDGEGELESVTHTLYDEGGTTVTESWEETLNRDEDGELESVVMGGP